MFYIPLHAKAVPRLEAGAQTSNSSISDPGDLNPGQGRRTHGATATSSAA
jgi:hypothetical protein